jgi:hypothetical protein
MKKLILLFSFVNFYFSASSQQIRSILFNPDGTDPGREYFELSGTPGQSLSGICFVVIDGDGSAQPGKIINKIDLTGNSFGSNGLFLYKGVNFNALISPATSIATANFSPALQNGTTTFVLMNCPTELLNSDVDSDNDGTLNPGALAGTVYDAVSSKDAAGFQYADDLGGTNIPTKVSTVIASELLIKVGGVWYGADVVNPPVPPFPSSPSNQQIVAAWSSTGVVNTSLTSLITSPGLTTTSFPVKLTQLTANIFQEKQSILNWQTSSETGFSHFEVQRSADAKGFETIGREESKGQNTDRNDYEFIDSSPIIGQNYYRLKSVDLDGTEEYSKILGLNFKEPEGLVFYPNPALNALEMKGLEVAKIEKVNVYNNVGLLIGSPKVIDNKIDMSTFAAQMLWLEAILTDKSIYRKKVVKF